jgi:hypothetical protein
VKVLIRRCREGFSGKIGKMERLRKGYEMEIECVKRRIKVGSG